MAELGSARDHAGVEHVLAGHELLVAVGTGDAQRVLIEAGLEVGVLVDGALVGGAALKVDDFTTLVELAAQAKGV